MDGFMNQFQKMNITSKQMILYNMLKSLKQDPKSVEAYSDMEKIKKFFAFQVESDNPVLGSTTTERISRSTVNLEEFQDHGGEELDDLGNHSKRLFHIKSIEDKN